MNNPGNSDVKLYRLYRILLLIFAASVVVARLRLGTEIEIGSLYTKLQGLLVIGLIFIHSVSRIGIRRSVAFASAALIVPSITESLGVRVGLVFGAYSYTDALGFHGLPGIPLYISLAWYVSSYMGYQVAAMIIDETEALSGGLTILLFSLLAAIATTGWDLFLDPVCVRFGAWSWHTTGTYFGIPVSNYIGWLATALIINLLYTGFSRVTEDVEVREQPALMKALPVAVLMFFVHALAGFCILNNMPGPAFCGWIVFLPFFILAFGNRKVDGRSLTGER